jgi:hypothetical protein
MSVDANQTEQYLRPHPKCLLTVLDDGNGVILNLDTKFYFTLNETGVALWQALEGGAGTAREIARELAQKFEVEESEALDDVRAVLLELVAEHLVERV